jgi:hypothetical protein
MVFLAALSLASTAAADEYSASEDAGRRGLLIGVGLQAGHIRFQCQNDPNCGDNVNESGGLNISLAYMMTDKLAFSVDGWAMVHRSEFLTETVTVTHSMLTVGPQIWLVPRIWVRGGVGWARLSVDFGDIQAQSESVLGIMGAVGWEVLTSSKFALDVQVRAGTGFYDGVDAANAGLGLGFTWF